VVLGTVAFLLTNPTRWRSPSLLSELIPSLTYRFRYLRDLSEGFPESLQALGLSNPGLKNVIQVHIFNAGE
jgi:hypothetical protein